MPRFETFRILGEERASWLRMTASRQSEDTVFKNACNVTLPKSDEPRILWSIRVVSFDIFIGGLSGTGRTKVSLLLSLVYCLGSFARPQYRAGWNLSNYWVTGVPLAVSTFDVLKQNDRSLSFQAPIAACQLLIIGCVKRSFMWQMMWPMEKQYVIK